MKVSVAASAPCVPPDTGASIILQLRFLTSAASWRVTAMEMVLLSTKSVPAGMLERIPVLAQIKTSRT